ncbi:MAG: hypothetical protein H0U76_25775 [Ktedonobacteraceae bacterium]|nr:hypothetical protein [Ktedonobacteraceae bacterium]
MREPLPPVLTIEQQFRQHLAGLPELSPNEEHQLVERARTGDRQAKEDIILRCMAQIAGAALRYRWLRERSIEYSDLVQLGNLALVEMIDQALVTSNPFAYLIGAASRVIRFYCYSHDSLVPHEWNKPRLVIDSLDVPLEANGHTTLADIIPAPAETTTDEQVYDALYQAVQTLPAAERVVVGRYFGLYGARETLSMIERDLGIRAQPGCESKRGSAIKQRALKRLRVCLAPQYQYAS